MSERRTFQRFDETTLDGKHNSQGNCANGGLALSLGYSVFYLDTLYGR